MALITHTRSIAAISWIDAITGLPETDPHPPGVNIGRTRITGRSGYRFANFLDAWIVFDTIGRTVTRFGFGRESGIYRSPSFADVPSEEYTAIRSTRSSGEPVIFKQLVGARTRSPEVLGGMAYGPLGNILGGLATSFPPIWTELELSIYNDGRFEGRLLQYSIFPSVSLYITDLSALGWTYTRRAIQGMQYYDASTQLGRWEREGWGTRSSSTSLGPVAGNPWGITDSWCIGIRDEPFGWL